MALQRQTWQLFRKVCLRQAISIQKTDVNQIHRWVAPTLRELQKRKTKVGPLPPQPRSSYLEWNFDAEIYAFGKRVGEEFDQDILRQALTHKSYLNLKDFYEKFVPISTKENGELVSRGEEIISKLIQGSFSDKYPEVVVKAVKNYLMSDDMLSNVAKNIGLTDIILTSEFPVETVTLSKTFKAIVAALSDSTSCANAENFVKDILFSQMNGKEIFDIWQPEQPFEYLKTLTEGKDIEPRLCNQSATNTILANYQVGIYSEKKLLGIGWGECIDVAKDTAALDAIQKIYNLN